VLTHLNVFNFDLLSLGGESTCVIAIEWQDVSTYVFIAFAWFAWFVFVGIAWVLQQSCGMRAARIITRGRRWRYHTQSSFVLLNFVTYTALTVAAISQVACRNMGLELVQTAAPDQVGSITCLILLY
jgi:hypothetical protein